MFGLSRLFAAKPQPQPADDVSVPHAERFTPAARALFASAVNEARAARHEYLGTEHLLTALARSNDPLARALFDACGAPTQAIVEGVATFTQPAGLEPFVGVAVCTPYAQRVLEAALAEARFLNHELAGVGHLFVGLLHENGGVAWQVLDSLGVTVERGREALMQFVPPGSA